MKVKVLAITTCLFFGLMGNGFVQADGNEYINIKNKIKRGQLTQVDMQNAHEIIGMRVTNKQGKELGELDNLIFSNDGRLIYLIVSSGSLTAGGGALTPVPYEVISYGFEVSENSVCIPVTSGRFETAPKFTTSQMNNIQNMTWERKASAYFGN